MKTRLCHLMDAFARYPMWKVALWVLAISAVLAFFGGPFDA